MRLLPVLIALVVTALIYALVFEHESFTTSKPTSSSPMANETAAPDDAAIDQNKVMRVVAVRSVGREVDSAVVVRGRTEADRVVELRAETSGLVINDPRRKGTMIEQGDLLCRLDPAAREATLAEARARLLEAQTRVPESEARADEARAQLEEAQINANAAENLVQEGFASQTRVAATRAAVSSAQAAVQSATSGLEAARAGIESARASVAAAEQEIERLTISAPFAGVLDTDTAEIGSLLQPGALCAIVLQLDPITLVGFVSEMQVSRVQMNAPATARMASGREVEGRVTFVSRSADDTTRTFRIEVKVPNPDTSLRDGETAEIMIGAEGKTAHLLPQSALTLNDEGTLGLRIVDVENRAQFVAVHLLRDSPSGVWVTGLPDKADVIIIGQEFVTDGVAVEPVFQDLSQ